MLENLDKIMHLRFNFDACPMHSPSGFVHLTHQNLSARALFCLNSLAKVNTQLLIYKYVHGTANSYVRRFVSTVTYIFISMSTVEGAFRAGVCVCVRGCVCGGGGVWGCVVCVWVCVCLKFFFFNFLFDTQTYRYHSSPEFSTLKSILRAHSTGCIRNNLV